MSRYWRVLKLFWSTALAAEMEYRVHFLISALTASLSLSGSLFTLYLFYHTAHGLGGWTWSQALLVMGLFTLLDGFSMTFLAPNLNRIVQHVQQGTLDFVLLKPIDSQFWLSTRNFSPWGTTNILLGAGLTVYASMRSGVQGADVLPGLVLLALAVLVLYGLWFTLATTSVWFVKIHNATEVLRNLLEAGRYPAQAYPVGFRIVFTLIVPVAFLTTVPAEAMLGRARWPWLGGAVLLAIVTMVGARLFWRFALRYYTSASS